MKATGSTIKRVGLVGAMVSLLLMSGSITALARPVEGDSWSNSIPTTQPVPADTVSSGGFSWILPLFIAIAIVALSAAVIGTVRFHKARAVGASA